MGNLRYRKHPRVYQKQAVQEEDNSITLSGVAAVGILALTFAKGVFWGYVLRKKWSH